MIIGLIGLGYGFLSAPSSISEAKEMVSDSHHSDDHSSSTTNQIHDNSKHASSSNHIEKSSHDSGDHKNKSHNNSHAEDHTIDHDEHLLHQLQNRPWAALYVAALFFFMIPLGVLAFYAINRAAQAGWSIVLFRVMEGITGYLIIGSISIFIILVLSVMHFNHLFIWMDPEVVSHDELIQGKSGYLNSKWFLLRTLFYLLGWNLYRFISRRISLSQDQGDFLKNHKKNFRLAAGFLVFYIYTESMMSWDWIMSIDPHWFSTLFGWYVFSSMFVTGITVIALVTIYLKSQGYLEFVNVSHIHNLGLFMFGVSVFWAYLWFSQFMLIWYSNIPEEVTYFITRIEDYPVPFFGMLIMNLIFPFLVLMNRDYKRSNFLIIMTGIIIVIGHYLDVFNMIMPSAVGNQWYIGIPEIGGFMFFLGLFIFSIFKTLEKAPLLTKGDPFLKESQNFHY
ncbi:MAG: quinol:cytochrome C oxidoreductase [Alphaproteobacteria bacterium]